jgi:hypothetical protein
VVVRDEVAILAFVSHLCKKTFVRQTSRVFAGQGWGNHGRIMRETCLREGNVNVKRQPIYGKLRRHMSGDRQVKAEPKAREEQDAANDLNV